MNKNEKQSYLKKYKKQKENGVPFFPDILFKDAVISLVIFLILLALTIFVGAPLEERADPSDTSYTPRPEWYFMFLFQLLKYFPGELEVIGVVVLPIIGVFLLFFLPFLDHNRFRHFMNRKLVTGTVGVGILSIGVLSILSIIETPPPSEIMTGDQTAALYTQNCAGCHGPTINVPSGTNLHDIISEGDHEGMPPWSADLTDDQIDALVGFILSPLGSNLFTANCGECHEATDLVSLQPLELKSSLEEGVNYDPHSEVEIPQWPDILSPEERTSLLNFLIAPDGQRLFVTNCSSCHGSSVAISGSEEELRKTISEGGLHLEMPGWQGKLSDNGIDILTNFILDPASAQEEDTTLYEQNCTGCHFDRIPSGEDYDLTYNIIAAGGSHEEMPVWGDLLTEEQLDALVAYTIETAEGASSDIGRELYLQNCASCHGDFGEGGANPARPGDIIAPISTEEYLKTRDNLTLKAIISQGQPNFGMSPFSISFGGPLDNSDVDLLVTYIRSWEEDPPVELPPEVQYSAVALNGAEIYQGICAQCHGLDANGGVGSSLRSPSFRSQNTSETIFASINEGHQATSMIAWGDVLSSEQIVELVDFIFALPVGEAGGGVSYAAMVNPIFESSCQVCHNDSQTLGGWNSVGYENVMNTGNSSPVIIPGDVENSLLAQMILGILEDGTIMPPLKLMDEDTIQIILEWIAAGAPDN